MSERRHRTPLILHAPPASRDDRGAWRAGNVAWNLAPASARHVRTVRFPKNRVLGELFSEPCPASGRSLSEMKGLGKALGEVSVPAGQRLVLYAEKEMSERDLKALAKLAPMDLQSLLLSGCDLSDASLTYLRNLTWLEHLDLSCNSISGEGLTHLGGMLLLERLELWGCALTEAGLAHLPPLPSLRDLAISLHFELPDSALAHLDSLPALENLDLHSTPIGNEALAHLKKLRKLRYLDISYTRISQSGAAELCAALPRCKISWAPTSA